MGRELDGITDYTATFPKRKVFADRHTTGLCGGDGLLLAVCADYGATLCIRDKRLAAAGPLLGVKTLLL